MWFFLLRIFKIGLKAHKTHKAKKNGTLNPNDNNNTYPMTSNTAATQPPGPPPRNKLKHYLDLTLHTLHLALGLTALALYAHHIHRLHEASQSAGAKYIYAIVTALLACTTAMGYLVLIQYILKNRVPVARRRGWQFPLFVWEGVLCVVWLTLFGIFGGEFLGKSSRSATGSVDKEVVRMKRAVWIDLVNLGLWVVSAAWKGVRWWRFQKGDTGEDGGDGEKEVEGGFV